MYLCRCPSPLPLSSTPLRYPSPLPLSATPLHYPSTAPASHSAANSFPPKMGSNWPTWSSGAGPFPRFFVNCKEAENN